MPTATITSKGQVTVPKAVRDHLGLAEGDKLDFAISADGSVRLVPVGRSVRELRGLLHDPDARPVTVEEMNEAIAESRARDDARIRESWHTRYGGKR